MKNTILLFLLLNVTFSMALQTEVDNSDYLIDKFVGKWEFSNGSETFRMQLVRGKMTLETHTFAVGGG